jgi:hypothetical protein
VKEITDEVVREMRAGHAVEQTEAWAATWHEADSMRRAVLAHEFMRWLHSLPDAGVAERCRLHFRRLLGLEG